MCMLCVAPLRASSSAIGGCRLTLREVHMPQRIPVGFQALHQVAHHDVRPIREIGRVSYSERGLQCCPLRVYQVSDIARQ